MSCCQAVDVCVVSQQVRSFSRSRSSFPWLVGDEEEDSHNAEFADFRCMVEFPSCNARVEPSGTTFTLDGGGCCEQDLLWFGPAGSWSILPLDSSCRLSHLIVPWQFVTKRRLDSFHSAMN